MQFIPQPPPPPFINFFARKKNPKKTPSARGGEPHSPAREKKSLIYIPIKFIDPRGGGGAGTHLFAGGQTPLVLPKFAPLAGGHPDLGNFRSKFLIHKKSRFFVGPAAHFLQFFAGFERETRIKRSVA